jgi:hypothetical protein
MIRLEFFDPSGALEADFPGIEVLPIDPYPQGNTRIGNAA